jgi:hypothetical protein
VEDVIGRELKAKRKIENIRKEVKGFGKKRQKVEKHGINGRKVKRFSIIMREWGNYWHNFGKSEKVEKN